MLNFHTLEFKNNELEILDQTLLPGQETYILLKTVEEVYDAIKTLKLRGAPAIGVGAAYGVVIAARNIEENSREGFLTQLREKCDYLISSRPTAVNLQWAVERMWNHICGLEWSSKNEGVALLKQEAGYIEQEDKEICKAIGENLCSLFRDGNRILTHCNAGALATAGYGTALSVFYVGMEKGMNLKAYADETRPLGQGARITAWELNKMGVDTTLICDNMAACAMSKGLIDAVIVGCDRIAENGDTANKIGTLGVSILAKEYDIPFYVAAPTPTIDIMCRTGKDIPIEERCQSEVTNFAGRIWAPEGIKAFNPSFDVTPAENITAIVTEKGSIYPPFKEGIKRIF